jgi:hypothetical protein
MRLRKIILASITASALTACGGGGGGSSQAPAPIDNNDTPDNEPTVALNDLTVSLGDQKGAFVQGSIPYSQDSSSAVVTSAPDMVKTNASSKERIDLVYAVDSSIEEIYFSMSEEDGHISFSKEQMASALATSTAQTEAVSLIVEIPELADNSDFCTTISVKTANQMLSDLTEVCFSVDEQNASNRVVYFADHSANSNLSTLNFDTGEVVDIGATGYALTDIAFFGDELYGVTFTQLISIDLETGEGAVVGNIGINNVNGLEGGEYLLYAGTTDGEFLSIDPQTGEGTIIDFFGSGATSSGDLVLNEDNDFLYGSLEIPGSATDAIAKIDRITGATEIMGDTGFDEVWGLALFRSQLLGLTTDGELIIIDRTRGNGTLIENTDSFNAGGAAAVKN